VAGVRRSKLWHIHLERPLAFATPEQAHRFRSISLFTGAGRREPVAAGRADIGRPHPVTNTPAVERVFHLELECDA
jgi:hypothetical protein